MNSTVSDSVEQMNETLHVKVASQELAMGTENPEQTWTQVCGAKAAYDVLMRVNNNCKDTAASLEECIQMFRSDDAYLLESCISSNIIRSDVFTNITDKLFDVVPSVLLILIERSNRLNYYEVDRFRKLLEYLCQSDARCETITFYFCRPFAIRFLADEYRTCVNQISLAVFASRLLTTPDSLLDVKDQETLDELSQKFFEKKILYAAGIKYALKNAKVRNRLAQLSELKFTPDSSVRDCVDVVKLMLTSIPTSERKSIRYDSDDDDDKVNFRPLLTRTPILSDLFLNTQCTSRETEPVTSDLNPTDKEALIDLMLALGDRSMLKYAPTPNYLLTVLISWLPDLFTRDLIQWDRTAVVIIRVLEFRKIEIQSVHLDDIITTLFLLVGRYIPRRSYFDRNLSNLGSKVSSHYNLCDQALHVLEELHSRGSNTLKLEIKKALRKNIENWYDIEWSEYGSSVIKKFGSM